MRRTIEKLAWLISTEAAFDATLGELSTAYGEPVDRIQDAIDVLKIRQGIPTQIPPVDWDDAAILAGARARASRHPRPGVRHWPLPRDFAWSDEQPK